MMYNNWHKKEIKRSLSDNELYIGWMQDLDYIILYESDLIKMLNKMRMTANALGIPDGISFNELFKNMEDIIRGMRMSIQTPS